MHKSRPLLMIVLFVLALILGACGGADSSNDSSFEFSENSDTANQNDNNGEAQIPEVTFRLQNQGSHSTYVQAGTEPGPGWLSVTFAGEDEAIHVLWDCGLPCECPVEGQEVTACMDCGMMPPSPRELAPGEEVSFTWNGLQRAIRGDCFEKVQLYDDHMEAQFCHGAHPGHDDIEGYIEDVRCETVDFQLGVDQEVVVTIEDDSLPPLPATPEIEFAVENQSDQPIFIQYGVSPMPSWLSVWRGDEYIRIQVTCDAPNECDSGDPPVACGMPMPTVREIPPGAEERLRWNGINYHIPPGQYCYEEIQLYDEILDVEICYGFDVDQEEDFASPQYVKDPICESVTFDLLHDEEAVVTAH